MCVIVQLSGFSLFIPHRTVRCGVCVYMILSFPFAQNSSFAIGVQENCGLMHTPKRIWSTDVALCFRLRYFILFFFFSSFVLPMLSRCSEVARYWLQFSAVPQSGVLAVHACIEAARLQC